MEDHRKILADPDAKHNMKKLMGTTAEAYNYLRLEFEFGPARAKEAVISFVTGAIYQEEQEVKDIA
jgi:hypothetical protein